MIKSWNRKDSGTSGGDRETWESKMGSEACKAYYGSFKREKLIYVMSAEEDRSGVGPWRGMSREVYLDATCISLMLLPVIRYKLVPSRVPRMPEVPCVPDKNLGYLLLVYFLSIIIAEHWGDYVTRNTLPSRGLSSHEYYTLRRVHLSLKCNVEFPIILTFLFENATISSSRN